MIHRSRRQSLRSGMIAGGDPCLSPFELLPPASLVRIWLPVCLSPSGSPPKSDACTYTRLLLLIFIIVALLTPSGVQAAEEGYSGSKGRDQDVQTARGGKVHQSPGNCGDDTAHRQQFVYRQLRNGASSSAPLKQTYRRHIFIFREQRTPMRASTAAYQTMTKRGDGTRVFSLS